MRRVAHVALLCVLGSATSFAQSPAAPSSGADLYRRSCAACHGVDGKGLPAAIVGFDTPVPDFSDCSFGTPEADADWVSVVHDGGPARAFDQMMPAFGEALAISDIELVVNHVRTFCSESGWPRGDLNLPRALVTEKAFPENETVLTTTFAPAKGQSPATVSTQLLYERRLGRRGQVEFAVPLQQRQSPSGRWQRGQGDLAVAYKHALFDSLRSGTIVSGGIEATLPTGKESEGLGSGATQLESYTVYTQLLPRDTFFHVHIGTVFPVGVDRPNRTFLRTALGKTWFQSRWYRAWTPMVEVLGLRQWRPGATVDWDVVPQIQVSLSTRQHVLLNVGVRQPVTTRNARGPQFITYLLWDWFDGGFFDGW